MISDTERREVARRLRHSWVNVPDKNPVRHQLRVLFEIYSAVGFGDDDDADAVDLFDRLADLIEPPYPDASASYKGWRSEVYDPDGVLASPSNTAADLVRARADGKMRHSTKEEQGEYSAMLEKMSVELHPVDRDALLELADKARKLGDEENGPASFAVRCTFRVFARDIYKALGVCRED